MNFTTADSMDEAADEGRAAGRLSEPGIVKHAKR